MKITKYTTIIILFLSIIMLSSCRKDDRPAKLNTDTSNIIFLQGESSKYFGLINTGNTVMNYQIEAADDLIETYPSEGSLGFNDLAKIEVKINTSGLDYGMHESYITLTSNGGTQIISIQVFIPLPTPAKLWWDIDYIKIPTTSDKDYITIKNEGDETLTYSLTTIPNSSWMSLSSSEGQLESGEEDKVWVSVDRTGLSNDLYSGVIKINSNGGKGEVKIDMEVGVYSVTFFNPTYTNINIRVPGEGSQTIPVLNRTNYLFNSNPGNITYTATTKGETTGNQTLGLLINWNETIDLSGESSPIFDLNISKDFFFLSAINYGSHDLDQWSINYNTNYQFDEDVLIPNDNTEYTFGYYDALSNSNVYARIVGTEKDAVWENGKEFDFPWTINQSIRLESSLKSTAKSSRSFKKSGESSGSLKITDNRKTKLRVRGAVSRINKR